MSSLIYSQKRYKVEKDGVGVELGAIMYVNVIKLQSVKFLKNHCTLEKNKGRDYAIPASQLPQMILQMHHWLLEN